jgi:hypothetical protein
VLSVVARKIGFIVSVHISFISMSCLVVLYKWYLSEVFM